ncbi:MAG: tRNA preQ1(34) S-adenosylmethionine ribosyltransferase-isomerase QueA [Bacteroidetes bacterium]|nr:tRNA preQ1(34) S-adenosylmethionine ribosyltransferase-isomerase QueA [Bacteroidota bacterium]
MKLSSLKFTLPKENIAMHPPVNREDSRLMVVHKETGKIEHRVFKDISEYFNAGDSLIINDSKVFPAKLIGKKEKTGAKIEVFLLRELKEEDHQWDALVDPARKIRVGNKLYFGNMDLVAEVSDNTTSRGRTLRFLFDGTTEELYEIFDKLGSPPIPDWILNREVLPEDKERYQTIYAKNIGAVVPSFAGFHFNEYILKLLEYKGINITPITIHSGLSDMSIIDVEDVTKYRINAEYFKIGENTCSLVNKSIENKLKVCAVGLSALKAVESSSSSYRTLKPIEGWTNKFLIPSYDFKICNSLITNFHIPKSTLFVNAAAFVGEDLLMEAYNTALKEDYRFFIYGDSMLVI